MPATERMKEQPPFTSAHSCPVPGLVTIFRANAHGQNYSWAPSPRGLKEGAGMLVKREEGRAEERDTSVTEVPGTHVTIRHPKSRRTNCNTMLPFL
jgi:hypothetical protein